MKTKNRVNKTEVTFDQGYMTNDKIRDYVEKSEWWGKAGAYGI